jgi:TetR/AcrR family transcriptional repressor of nem operon
MPKTKLYDKDEMLQKAMTLFWKQGFHATSMQELVNYLGINRSSIYDSFGSKKNLFDDALELYYNSAREATLELLNNEPKVKNGVMKLLESSIFCVIDDIDKKGCFVVNTASELIPGDRELLLALIKNKEIFETIFYEYLLKGKENGEITSDVDLKIISHLVYTMLCGINIVAKIQDDRKCLVEQITLVMSLLD